MICRVDGVAIEIGSLTYRELGFGQNDWPSPAHRYDLVFDEDEFVRCLASRYDAFLAEQREEDQSGEEPSPAYFKTLGYPTLRELLRHPNELAETVREYLWDDLFASSLRSSAGANWVINSIESVTPANGRVTVSGTAFEKQPAMV